MLRIDILFVTRGSTHVEREEGSERPKSKEYAPHHKDEEKLTGHGYIRQPIAAAQLKSKSPFGSARQRTGRSLRRCTVSLPTGEPKQIRDVLTWTMVIIFQHTLTVPPRSASGPTPSWGRNKTTTYLATRPAMMCPRGLDDPAPITPTVILT
jgi:hypothetical protein